MSWFRVMVEVNEPTARNPPATKKRAEIGREDGAVVRIAEVVDRDPDGEGERERDADESPGGQEFAEHRLPQRDGLGEQQLDAAVAPFLGPQPHRHGGDQEQIEPGQEVEEGSQVRLAALVQGAEEEREQVRQQQEDDDDHVGERRREVTRELAAQDDTHGFQGFRLRVWVRRRQCGTRLRAGPRARGP